VKLSFDRDSFTVTGDTLPGHFLEGERTRSVKFIEKDPCSLKVVTDANERSVNLNVEVYRVLDMEFGPNQQRKVWDIYLGNIAEFWKTKGAASVKPQ
jgi:hypothetical protein